MIYEPWPGYKGDRPTHPEAFAAPGPVDVATMADLIEAVRDWQEARARWEDQSIDDEPAFHAAFHEYYVTAEVLRGLVLPPREAADE